jgi:hypothetical protein
VLVARHDTIPLSKGYRLANRAYHGRNSPLTTYDVSGVQSSLPFFGVLWLEEHGKLADHASICR